jgi:hypothetical protein
MWNDLCRSMLTTQDAHLWTLLNATRLSLDVSELVALIVCGACQAGWLRTSVLQAASAVLTSRLHKLHQWSHTVAVLNYSSRDMRKSVVT